MLKSFLPSVMASPFPRLKAVLPEGNGTMIKQNKNQAHNKQQSYAQRRTGAIKASNAFYLNHALPILANNYGFTSWVNCEIANPITHPTLYKLDREYGVDFIAEGDGTTLLFSTRVTKFHPRCITLRETSYTGCETELAKRERQFRTGKLDPNSYLTVHCWGDMDTGTVFQLYLVQTSQVLDYLENGGKFQRETNACEGNTYLVIKVADLTAAGIEVEIIEATPFAAWKAQQEAKALESLREALQRLRAARTSPSSN